MEELDRPWGLWYGPAPSKEQGNEAMALLKSATTRRERAKAAIQLLKLGDFSVKAHLVEGMREAERGFRDLCFAVFCAVAGHDDLAEVGAVG